MMDGIQGSNMDEKELISSGIKWLSQNIIFRDEEMNKSHGKSEEYAVRESRVIRRVTDYVSDSVEQCDEFHVLLMEIGEKLHNDIFQLFMKIWSRQDRKFRPIIVDATYHKLYGRWRKES